jgi:2'-5' RNA ligase
MKLNDILLEKNKKETKDENKDENLPAGTYVAVRFSEETKDNIKKLIEENDIPNPNNKLHATVMHSLKELPELLKDSSDDRDIDPPFIGHPKKLRIFKTEDENNALVLEFKSQDLVDRHNEIKEKYGAEYKHDEYIPHITLSYDCNDFDFSKIDIKKYIDEIEIINEYIQPVDSD